MSHWKELLGQTLEPGEASASALDAEARNALKLILAEASVSNETEALLHELNQCHPFRDPARGLLARAAYARGATLLELARPDEALQAMLPLCEKIEQSRSWPLLAQVADEVLGGIANVEAARYLAKAIEEGGEQVAPEGSITRAMEFFPDEHRICWLAAEAAERQGDTERAQALFAGCLPALVEAKNLERVEEVFVRLEDQNDATTTLMLMQACIRLAIHKSWNEAETHLEKLLPHIKAAGLARDAWGQFLKILPKAPETSSLRRLLMDIAPEALPGVDGVLDLLGRSGLLDPAIKVETALKKLAELLEFAPGYRVLHQNWGPGRIRANEVDALVIDFPDKPRHRMSLGIARKSLKVIPPDDLRVLAHEDPERVKAMVKGQRANLAYLAIRELGGKVTSHDLRRRLTPIPITTSSWSTWWKDARAEMEKDERFDFSESYRQIYAISSPAAHGDDEDVLPRLDRRRGVRANLNLLRRFLDQHPQHTERAVKVYTPVLVRWLRDEHTNPEAAVAICLTLDRWGMLESEDMDRSLRELLSSGIEAAAFADPDAQRLLATHGLALKGMRREAIFFTLGSRYPDIRKIALEELGKDDEDGSRLLEDLLSRPEERQNTALSVIVAAITEEGEKDPLLPSPWRAAVSLCRLVERTGRDSFRDQIMRLFHKNSQMATALRHTPLPEDVAFTLGEMLRRWRQSEDYLFPILDFFEGLGAEEVVQTVRGSRQDATNLLLTQQRGEGTYEGFYLTRSTYERLEQERNFLTSELKTTVARAIQTAREHGDLSENAEYHAAKEKQGQYAARIQQIGEVLGGSTLIENLRVPEGEVGPGCWVQLRTVSGDGVQPGELLSYWLLGEGDSHIAPEVISCAAPAAKSLLGHRVGDQVLFQHGESAVRAEVVSAERRLPEREPQR
jgi:transcription elongation factor GreA